MGPGPGPLVPFTSIDPNESALRTGSCASTEAAVLAHALASAAGDLEESSVDALCYEKFLSGFPTIEFQTLKVDFSEQTFRGSENLEKMN